MTQKGGICAEKVVSLCDPFRVVGGGGRFFVRRWLVDNEATLRLLLRETSLRSMGEWYVWTHELCLYADRGNIKLCGIYLFVSKKRVIFARNFVFKKYKLKYIIP